MKIFNTLSRQKEEFVKKENRHLAVTFRFTLQNEGLSH